MEEAFAGVGWPSTLADRVAEVHGISRDRTLTAWLRSTLRAAVFLVVRCGWSLLRGRRRLQRNIAPALVSSDLMVEGLTLLLGLKLFWITAIDPLHLSASAP